jgi:hypothetical protein
VRRVSRIDRLTQWQSGGTSLRTLNRARNAGDWSGEPTAHAENDTGDSTQRVDWALGAARCPPPDATALGTDLEAEVGATLLWGDDESDDSRIPGDALPVYRTAGTWRDESGELRATIHGFAPEAAYSRGECVLGQSSLWQESAALSMQSLPPGDPVDAGADRQRRAIHDVRPHLLLLLHAEDTRALEPCLRYGLGYLRAWCQRNANASTPAAIEAAACDGLASLYRCREAPPRAPTPSQPLPGAGCFAPLPAWVRTAYSAEIREGYEASISGWGANPYPEDSQQESAWQYGWDWAERRSCVPSWREATPEPAPPRRSAKLSMPSADARARELGMRKEGFALLRNLAFQTYTERLAEAEQRFMACANYVAPRTGASDGSGHRSETWWRDRNARKVARNDCHPQITKLLSRKERRPQPRPTSRAARVMAAT